MLKKIITFLFFFLFVFIGKTFAVSIPVEQVFSDISKDYKYYNELQTLYDKGMIFPDSEGKFNPKKLLNRDEFVGIMMEVSCEKCISPNVSYDLFQKYNSVELFFDINKNNKYFYCIAGADYSGYVKGYDVGTKCENGNYKEGEKPFCPNNTIILEEALAVILRASGILTNTQADIIRMQIANGQITKNLSDDVAPKNLDGSVYSFYPDFQKALDYELVEYDRYGNQKIYKMVELIDGKLRPKQAISKEDFLKIAYISLKGNSCSQKKDEKLGLEIKIYNKNCTESNIKNCSISSLTGTEKIYDFYGNVSLPIDDDITNTNSYIWRFYNFNTGEEIIKYGQYIDNYDFLKDGDYRVFFRVVSDNGNTSEVYNDIKISSDNIESNNKLSINANPISGNTPLLVNFSSIFSGNNNGSTYSWDFGDGTSSLGKNVDHIYKEPGVYKITLTVKDNLGEINISTININVFDIKLIDTDGDGVDDSEDNEKNTPRDKILYICTKEDISNKRYDCKTNDMLGVYSSLKEQLDTDGDGVDDSEDNEKNTPRDKILYICTKEDISNNRYDCKTNDMLGVYSSLKEQSDTDGDGVDDSEDNEKNTPKDKILYICTKEDISNNRYDCKTNDMLGVYSIVKENPSIGDYDNDGVNDLLDACPKVSGDIKNKGCPVFDKFCSVDTDCQDGYYCNSGICSPKQISNTCEYTGGDLVMGNVSCNSCPCSNFVDFNSILRKCDIVFPAIVSPDKSTIYSKGNYFQIR